LHFLLENLDDFPHISVRLIERIAFGRNVAVMKCKKWHTQKFEHLERRLGLEPGIGHFIAGSVPRPKEGLAPERIRAWPAE
jgi:hypothetical protein